MAQADLKWGFLPRSITPEQARDTGMAMVLLALLVGRFAGWRSSQGAAILLLVATMVVPRVFTWPAYLWMGLANVMGAVMSRVVLGAVFFLVFTPMGLLVRAFGHDAMRRRNWKASRASAFVARDHTYSGADLDRPY